MLASELVHDLVKMIDEHGNKEILVYGGLNVPEEINKVKTLITGQFAIVIGKERTDIDDKLFEMYSASEASRLDAEWHEKWMEASHKFNEEYRSNNVKPEVTFSYFVEGDE